MDTEAVNAVAAGLSAIATIFAVVIAALSIRELRRIDQRVQRRDINQLDQSLQLRLEALYPHLYRIFGVPDDSIPLRYRSAIIGFFGLYADAFASQRDGLLAQADAVGFLEEFDWWLNSENGRKLWGELRVQSWPQGFVEHVDAVVGSARPYSELPNRPAEFGLRSGVPGDIEFMENPDADILASADWALVNLRHQGNVEFPPAAMDAAFAGVSDPTERRSIQLKTYATWMTTAETLVWSRWVATMNGRVVGHVAVCEPHEYLSGVTDGEGIVRPGKALEVSRLFVEPRLQGHGIGGDLLARAVAFIHDFGCTPVLAVLVESQAALALYEKSGWQAEERFEGVQGTNILMVRP